MDLAPRGRLSPRPPDRVGRDRREGLRLPPRMAHGPEALRPFAVARGARDRSLGLTLPRLWRNWQTRRLQVPVLFGAWRFESSQPHLPLRQPGLAPAAQRGAEDVVPERGADSEAARVVLEVVAHVQLAHHLPEAGPRREVVQVVVR